MLLVMKFYRRDAEIKTQRSLFFLRVSLQNLSVSAVKFFVNLIT
jgi:hypothetical protein